jgi:hypothetical protein
MVFGYPSFPYVNLAQNGYSNQGVDVSGLLSGVYVVAIISTDGEVYYEKVLKTQSKKDTK